MSIGLYDMDMVTYGAAPFNLELMKLSSFYKNKKEVVILTPSFYPERHQKFFVRKDYYDGTFPPEIIGKNIEYGGYAFSQNRYISLNEDIEKQKPDVYIYQNFIKFFDTKNKQSDFKLMTNAEHIRLSLDGKTVWNNFQKQFHNFGKASIIIFHDYNLNDIDNAYEAIQDIFKIMPKVRNRSLFGTKFPIRISTEKDLIKWSDFPTTNNFSSYSYNGLIKNDESIYELIKKKHENGSFFKQFEYNIGATSYATNEEILKALPKIFKQVIFLRSYKLKFSLKYDEDFFFDKRWERVIDFLNAFINSYHSADKKKYSENIYKDCVYSFAKKLDEKQRFKTRAFNRQDAREIFQFVRENNYELFRLFYECGSVKLIGGEFKGELYRN